MNYSEQEWIRLFTKWGAFWQHSGNPNQHHALLTSGKHSGGFFNGSKLISIPMTIRSICQDLIEIGESKGLLGDVDSIVGSAFGAIDLSFKMGELLRVRRGFTEPQPDGSMLLKRFDLEHGEKVLLVEDVMTTGGTNRKTIKAIEEAGGIVLPDIFVICNRSGMKELDGRKVISLIDKEMPIWTPDECPLCKAGSEAIRPKGNWDKLTANYN